MDNNIFEYFKNKDLLNQALTHRSWVNEHQGIRSTNERLEFLGDAVLEFVVSDGLFKMFPDKEEGYLTALRSNLVNTTNLAKIAGDLSLGKGLFLSKGEEEGGGRENQSLLANTFEAVVGALFIDGGIRKAEDFINTHLLSKVGEIIKKPLKDAKSRLQEKVQAQACPAPKYVVVQESGPDHAKKFLVEVYINQKSFSKGLGKNKAEAEQKAAENALKKISAGGKINLQL